MAVSDNFRGLPTRVKVNELEGRVLAALQRIQAVRREVLDLKAIHHAVSTLVMGTSNSEEKQSEILAQLDKQIKELTARADQHSQHTLSEFAESWEITKEELAKGGESPT